MSVREEFVPHYVDYLRSWSHLATQDDYSALGLAAHLFAVGEQLFEDGHDLRCVPPDNRRMNSLEELGEALARLPGEMSARDLYQLVIGALSLIEAERCTRHDEDYRPPHPVEIPPIEIGDKRRLGGHVILWVRKPRSFRNLRRKALEEARELEASLPPSLLERPGQHLDRLFCHWKRDNGLPEVVRAVPEDTTAPLLSVGGHELAHGAPFRIALCPLVGEAHPLFVVTKDRRNFRTCDQTPMIESTGHTVREQLGTILHLVRQDGIHLVVLPELSIDPDSRAWLSETLRSSRSNFPMGVVAGSFHFDNEGNSRPHNESHLVDGGGRKLLEHHKRGRFRMTRQQLRRAVEKGLFRDQDRLLCELDKVPSPIPPEIDEHIEPGWRLQLLEAAVGQMAVLICADAIDELNRREMLDATVSLKPDFVLVPAMSVETDRFDEFVTRMERCGVATFFVNAYSICPTAQTLAAVCLDLYHSEGQPTRVRWRRGRGLEAWVRRELRGDLGPWQPLDPRGSPFDWLNAPDGQRLGLVVDLGSYWR